VTGGDSGVRFGSDRERGRRQRSGGHRRQRELLENSKHLYSPLLHQKPKQDFVTTG